MREITKKIWSLFAVSFLASCFLFTSLSFGQEMPKPGEVIDKSNYKKYAHLIPEGYLEGFEDGWGGLTKPLTWKVSETKPGGQPKAYLALSEKNRGKYTIDKEGFIGGGYDYLGLPFPGAKPGDENLGAKVMYNYRYRYMRDDLYGHTITYMMRKGESVTALGMTETSIFFVNRLYDPPKPFYKTPADLQQALLLHFTFPLASKDFMMLNYRYNDPKKSDDTYLYLPTMRRVLRGEAGQKSTPVQGMLYALDDYFGGFDGKTEEFNFKFLREQKVLACTESKETVKSFAQKVKESPKAMVFPIEDYSLRDAYVIEITPKDPKYPQSKKIMYMDKEASGNLYGVAYDRAGKLWKIFGITYHRVPLPDGDNNAYIAQQFAIDLQFGMSSCFIADFFKLAGNNIKYVDLMPSSLVKQAK
jgi:hypothetical protein